MTGESKENRDVNGGGDDLGIGDGCGAALEEYEGSSRWGS